MVKSIKHTYPTPTEEEFKLLCKTITNSQTYPMNNRGLFLRWRDVTILKLLFYCGLRPAECLNLRWKDVNFEREFIKVQPYFNKVKNDSSAQLSSPAKEALLDWYCVCQDLGTLFEFLFPSCETFEPVRADRFSRLFRDYAKEAGLLRVEWITETGQKKYNLSPYSGRRWFGTEVFRKTKSDYAVKFLMRHRQLSSSEPYIQPTQEDLTNITKLVFCKK